MKKFLGISLALVMLIGSVPLGFSEPLRVQLEQGIQQDQIQCDNPNHVLVLRTNGNVVCVTERTAEKTGWEIIQNTISLVYEFPISSKQLESDNITSMPLAWNSDVELLISALPKVGKTAEITVIFTNNMGIDTFDDFIKSFSVTKNFEIIDSEFPVASPNDDVYSVASPLKITKDGESDSMTITIKALFEGEGMISTTVIDRVEIIRVMIGENQTVLLDDYIETHPNYLTEKANAPMPEPEPQEETSEEIPIDSSNDVHHISRQSFKLPSR